MSLFLIHSTEGPIVGKILSCFLLLILQLKWFPPAVHNEFDTPCCYSVYLRYFKRFLVYL